MSQYFHTHDLVVNEEYYGKLCDTAISLLNIAYLDEVVLTSDLNGIYVNTKNKNRFISKSKLNYMSKEFWNKYGLATIRTEKAKKIFWKFMNHYIELLWD
jgi:predicted acetyltransferase